MIISLCRGKNTSSHRVGQGCAAHFECFHFLSSCSEGTLSWYAHGRLQKVLGGQLTVVTGTFAEPQHKASTSEPQFYKKGYGCPPDRAREKQVTQHPRD